MLLLYYTRRALADDIYAPKLADSVHFALVTDGKCTALSHNQGLVFAKAQSGAYGVLHAYSLRAPYIVEQDGAWHILARRIEVDGAPGVPQEGMLLHIVTKDFIHYDEQGLIGPEHDLAKAYEAQEAFAAPADWVLPEGCIPGGVIDIPEEVAKRLLVRFTTPVNVANDVPAQVEASCAEELNAVRAIARYSDGSTVVKRIDWCMQDVDWTKPGRYAVEGRVHQDRFEFPMAWHKADPAICRWQGKYYFISTNDLDNNHTIFIRQADTIPELVTAQQTCILDTAMYPHLGNLLWAPELHIIKDRLYIFHAGTPGPFVQEQSHVMALKEGGDPTKKADWEMSRRVEKADGSMLYGPEGITLDMTVFWAQGRLYASWSQRQFQPEDQGAWLMIAEIDPDQPWRLLSEPKVLTKPEYGWENNHTFVVEGPFALYHDGKVLLTYSGAAVDATYVVGMMSIDQDADPLDLANWTKENSPLLTSRCIPGEYGTGHNAYVTDEDGLVWNSYHARSGFRATSHGSSSDVIPGSEVVFGPRSSGIRRVHFNAEGFPVLDMTEELDLKPELAWVKTEVVVK